MHNAPSVTFSVGRSHMEVSLIAALSMLGLAVLGVWVAWAGAWQLAHTGMLGVWVLTTFMAVWRWWVSPVGTLHCSGGCWTLDQAPGRVASTLDMGSWMLLCWQAGEPSGIVQTPLWLWVNEGMLPGCWQDLRRAVYSSGT